MIEAIIFLTSLLIFMAYPLLVHIPWKCILLGLHEWQYAGQRSWMTFKKGERGVNGGHVDTYKCHNCGKVK